MKLKWKNRLMTVFLIVFSISFLIPVSNLNGQEEDSISIDFVDADIADVIRVLATARNLNYIIGEQVIGTVTIKLDDVSFNSALDAVITSNGFGYKIVENVLTVNTISKLKEQADIKQMIVSKQELLTFVFELKYINADDVIPILKNELLSRGKIFSLKKTIKELSNQIKELDHQGISSLEIYAKETKPVRTMPEQGSEETYPKIHQQAQIEHRGRNEKKRN